jgi:hypothetical protein
MLWWGKANVGMDREEDLREGLDGGEAVCHFLRTSLELCAVVRDVVVKGRLQA